MPLPPNLKKYLTCRQLEVVELMYLGFDRQGIADHLMPPVCIQAVHQIITRIKKRVKGADIDVRSMENGTR